MLKNLNTDCCCSTLQKILGLESRMEQSDMVKEVSVVIPKLEELVLHNIGDIMNQFPTDLYHRIKVLEVNGSLGESSIFPFLLRFDNLERLELSDLDCIDEVPCKVDAGILTRILNLKLSWSKNLKHIWKKDSELSRLLSGLQTLKVVGCDDLINVGPSSLSFQNLSTLKVYYCDNMRNLVTPTVVQNLTQLATLEVNRCNIMTEIVENEGDKTTYHHQILVFSKLKSLELIQLKSLTSFSPGSYNLRFPCLEKLVVEECSRLKIFSQGVLSTPLLQSVIIERYNDKKMHWSGDLDTTIQQLFIKKVAFDGQDKLKFSDTLPKMMEIWNGRNPQEYLDFKNLRKMEFCNCSSLKYIFTPSMLSSLKQLWKLKVKECDSMEEVIKEEEEATSTDKLSFPNLESIEIESCTNLTNFYLGSSALEFPELSEVKIAECPKMTAFCSSISREKGKERNGDGSPKGLGDVQDNTAAFFSDQVVCPKLWTLDLSSTNIHKIWHNNIVHERLYDLRVKGCHNLKYLFPSFNTTERLENLKELHIQNCDSLEEIFGAQGLIADESHAVTATQSITAEAVTTELAFPELTYLHLDKLPKLKSFCSRMHTTRWPLLEKLDVIECPQVQIFAPQSHCSGEIQTESQAGISNQQPLFSVNEDTFPSLEELTVKQNDMMKGICDGQLPVECFRELEALNLEFFPETSTTLPYSFIHSLPRLEKLLIDDASICQIVQSEGLGEDKIHTSRLAQIKELRLSKLAELTHLWKEEFQPGVALNNLRILQVLECGKLETLEPSLLSFKYLTVLEVSRCHRFIKLMARSTANSLTLLERMSITECEMIEEIISCEGEEIQGGIVFPKLKYLQLSCLPNLASFSLAHHMFVFPALLRVIVKKCNKMRNFCQGDLSTPNLQQMDLTRDDDDELWWEGDLNTTIKKMFNETNVQNSDVTEVPCQLPVLE